MAAKPIKMNDEINDVEFMTISMQARNAERAHLLGMLRSRLNLLEHQPVTPDDIFRALEQWIASRETHTSQDK